MRVFTVFYPNAPNIQSLNAFKLISAASFLSTHETIRRRGLTFADCINLSAVQWTYIERSTQPNSLRPMLAVTTELICFFCCFFFFKVQLERFL